MSETSRQAKILNTVPSGSGQEAWRELKEGFESVIAESEQVWRKHVLLLVHVYVPTAELRALLS